MRVCKDCANSEALCGSTLLLTCREKPCRIFCVDTDATNCCKYEDRGDLVPKEEKNGQG